MDVSVSDLRLSKNGLSVLQIPDLRFPSGTTTAVFGPNGSGKTTLLRVIAGLERPSTGEARVGGLPVRDGDAVRPLVGMAFQNAVFLRGSVRYNLDLALRLRGVPLATRWFRIEEAADECGVAHLLDRSAQRLSGGEAQRINLARVLALRAPVTLLDEPLSGVDRIARTQLLADLPGLLAKFTATTILVTHDREEAFRLADRLVVLIGGEVKAAGLKRAVYTRPPDRATAELLGYTVLPVYDTLVAIPPGGLRPGDNGRPNFTVAVEQVIDMGNHVHVVGKIRDERVDIRLPAGMAPPAPGTNMRVHAAADAVSLTG
jgi:ABC-type sugar transport system ATPase subunit